MGQKWRMPMKCLPSWDARAGNPFSDKLPFPGAKAILICCVRAGLFFGFFFLNLEEM